jgi:hypothetical protein
MKHAKTIEDEELYELILISDKMPDKDKLIIGRALKLRDDLIDKRARVDRIIDSLEFSMVMIKRDMDNSMLVERIKSLTELSENEAH